MRRTPALSSAVVLFVVVALMAQTLLSDIGLPTQVAYAQPERQTVAQASAGTPIGQVLDPDGTLNLATGFSGSLDPNGYEMQAGPNGEPRFMPLGDKKGPAPDGPDDYWDARFGFKGLNESVLAITVSGDSIYVGGEFTATEDGSLPLMHIARWSKSEGRWYPLGSGLNDRVRAILVVGSAVYAGGSFTATGDDTQTLTHVAKFQGGSWQEVAFGLGDEGDSLEEVRVLLADGNYIYAGGKFTEVCTPLCYPVNHIARWDATSNMWNGIDGGVSGSTGIYDMAMSSSGILYIGGGFTQAGGFAANDFAQLVSGHWYPLGNPGGIITTIAVSGSGNNEALYVGGDLGNLNNCCVEKWNRVSLQWDYLMDGVNTGVSLATDMATYGSDLYVSGPAQIGSSHPYIVKWNGSGWSNVGNSNGISGCSSDLYTLGVKAITISGGDIYAGGCFANVPGLSENVDNIAKWNISDSQWLGMNGGMNSTVNAVLVRDANVYVGGSFSEAGGIKANNVAKWDGTRWSSVSGGVNGTVYALALSPDGSQLYAGGAFTQAGGSLARVTANRVATLDLRCSNCIWQSLGLGAENGLDDTVNSIAVNSASVYVGGQFTHAGTHSASRVARWSLSGGWYALGGGLNDTIYEVALDSSSQYLYVAGKFTQTLSPIMSVNRVARWNTTSGIWSPLGYSWNNGVNGSVYAIAISGSNVYVGGAFTQAGGVNAAHVALWNGGWSALGNGLDSYVNTLTIVGTKIYAGGAFTGRIALWNGSWFSLGSGIGGTSSTVYSLSANAATGDLYVGGLFIHAGGKASRFIGLYHGQP